MPRNCFSFALCFLFLNFLGCNIPRAAQNAVQPPIRLGTVSGPNGAEIGNEDLGNFTLLTRKAVGEAILHGYGVHSLGVAFGAKPDLNTSPNQMRLHVTFTYPPSPGDEYLVHPKGRQNEILLHLTKTPFGWEMRWEPVNLPDFAATHKR